jgi:cystathionine beta-lyase/cystathionine gamma-synthase
MSNKSTLAVHAGRNDLRSLGVHALPLDLSSTYPFDHLSDATASFDVFADGGIDKNNSIYARLNNPTVRRFEEGLAQLEGAEDAVAFSSGMAAISAVILASIQTGDHIVAVRPLYGSADHLLDSGLLGNTISWAEADTVGESLTPDTSLIYIETPSNPTLKLNDIERIVRQANGVPVLVDNTFLTPILQNPIDCGATLSLHSATKYIGGHGDVLGGVVACSNEWAKRLRKIRVVTGGNLHPLAAYLLHRGLQTLPVRMERAQESAIIVADLLKNHPAVETVHYPQYDAKFWSISGTQMRGPGAIIAFTVRSRAEAVMLMESLRLITPAVSLGSTDTLIQHPAGLTHRLVDADSKAEQGISESLLRLSIGLEQPRDLWEDIEQALSHSCIGTASPRIVSTSTSSI